MGPFGEEFSVHDPAQLMAFGHEANPLVTGGNVWVQGGDGVGGGLGDLGQDLW